MGLLNPVWKHLPPPPPPHAPNNVHIIAQRSLLIPRPVYLFERNRYAGVLMTMNLSESASFPILVRVRVVQLLTDIRTQSSDVCVIDRDGYNDM